MADIEKPTMIQESPLPPMKVLTVWEPWASLLARGVKEDETRSKPTKYRGLIAIHASKNTKHLGLTVGLFAVARKTWMGRSLAARPRKDWPLGQIIGVGELWLVRPTVQASPSPAQRMLGIWTPGRYAWSIRDAHTIDPIPWTGVQGLRDLPANLSALALARYNAEMERWCKNHSFPFVPAEVRWRRALGLPPSVEHARA